MAYIFSQLAVSLLYLGSGVAHLVLLSNSDDAEDFKDALGQTPASFIIALVAAVTILSVGGLSGLHATLISRNSTTNEDLRHRYGVNPFDEGCFRNWTSILCGPRVPSRLFARDTLTDGCPRARPFKPIPEHMSVANNSGPSVVVAKENSTTSVL